MFRRPLLTLFAAWKMGTEGKRPARQQISAMKDVAVNMVIHPVSLLRIAFSAIERGLDELLATGTLDGQVAGMQTRGRLYELLDYEAYNAFDDGIFTYTGR